MPEKTYRIGDKTYIQRPLVLGQYRQLLDVLGKFQVPQPLDVRALIIALGSDIAQAIAIVLTPAPLWRRLIRRWPSPRDKKIEALAAKIDFAITPEQIIEVIEDFFVCNPLPLLLSKLHTVAGLITVQAGEKTESSPSASSSPGGTLPAAMPSSGDAP